MYAREIANDFVVSACTRITSADRDVKCNADENRANRAGFNEGHQKLLTSQNCLLCFLVEYLLLGSSNIESFKKNIMKKDLTPPLNNSNSCCNLCNSWRLPLVYPMCNCTTYMLHILIVYTFLLLFLICKKNNNFSFSFLCRQLVVKTKYIDTLIKLLLTFLPYSERQDIAVNHFILSLLTWGLSHKRSLHLVCFEYEIEWLPSYSVPKFVLNKEWNTHVKGWTVVFLT